MMQGDVGTLNNWLFYEVCNLLGVEAPKSIMFSYVFIYTIIYIYIMLYL